MRLNKYLARCGVASRREADRLIQSATTAVNGEIVLNPAYDVQPGDVVRYDGRVVTPVQEDVFLMLHKPKGVLTTASDPQGRPTVLDLVGRKERLFPVGRLDRDTTGLILLTNRGDLANRLLHPRYRVVRRYEAVIEGRLTPEQIQKVKRGIYIGEGEFGRAQVLRQRTEKKRTTVLLELREGKKREIRRLFHYLQIRLFELKRIQFGPLRLDPRLRPGHFRPLTPEETAQLLEWLRRSVRSSS
ncbi:MAG: rRNA pseudouridine synthase [Candidatus Neomarinimicrobiota bacterium]|nr:MAG: rRNA pseudouridine synthase [Candidatus Neomarinimicrobiota bacterium]